MPDPRIGIPEARLVRMDNGEVWDLETEEPVSDTAAYEAELVARIDDLDDDAFVDAVLMGVIHHVF